MPDPDPALATVSPVELAAMARALELATHGPVHGPNPRVGCVLLAPDGRRLAEGWHRGAGTPHAEVAALSNARALGADLTGSVAVVTLEPCDHAGRTGPCTAALIEAGISRVVYSVSDPNPTAAGGGERLRGARVDVVGGVCADRGHDLLRVWTHAIRSGRPFVTLKIASTLDGRVAASDGSSRWITSTAAREHAHRLRATVDAIAVGTGTVLADDPELTARTTAGAPATHQPLRVVVGRRDVPAEARLHGPGGDLVLIRTHDVDAVMAELAARQVRHVLVEGGPALATAILRAGVVDEVHAYLAPVLLGSGATAVGDLGITSIGGAVRLRTRSVERLGADVLLIGTPEVDPSPARPSVHTSDRIDIDHARDTTATAPKES